MCIYRTRKKHMPPPPPDFGSDFDQIFGQVFDQVFGQGFDQVLGEGKNNKYSVQYCRDGKIQCTIVLGRKNLLHRPISKKKVKLLKPPYVGF